MKRSEPKVKPQRYIEKTKANEVCVSKMNHWTLDASGTGEHDKISKIFLATRQDRARLICRVVRGVGVGAGLGFPVGDLRFAAVFTPNLRLN